MPFIAKKAATTLVELPDLPANLANLGESGLKWLAKKVVSDQKESVGQNKFAKEFEWEKRFANKLEDFSNQPNYFREENVDRPSKWIKSGLEQAGIDIEPRQRDAAQKIAGEVIEWAIPGGIATKLNKAAKGAAIAGSLGALSGSVQELFQADQLEGNLVALGTQFIAPKPISLLKRFSKSGRDGARETSVSKLLEDITKKQDLDRLKNFNPQSGDVVPVTAEVALNKDISNLHNAYAPNLTGIDAKRAYNDEILRKKLDAIGNNLNPSAVEVGEAGRSKIQKTLNSLEAKRTKASSDLYKKLEESQNTYPVSNFENYTNNAIINELGDIEKGLIKHQNILPTKYKKLAEKHEVELSKLEKKLNQPITRLDKEYPDLNVQAKEQILNQLVPEFSNQALKMNALKAEIAALKSGKYRPGHIDKAVSEIGNNIIALKRSEKGGNKSLIRHFKKQKEEMTKDLTMTPEGSAHRSVYSQHSKPINNITRDKLLKKFIDKNEFDQYRVHVDDLPRNIMKAPEQNIRNYMQHVKGSEAEALTKAYVRDMYLGKALEGSIPTYDKSNNFLRTRKEKMNAIYSPEELSNFDKINSYLKNRAEVAKGNSAYGSATTPKAELQAKVQKYLGPQTMEPLAWVKHVPALPFKDLASRQFIRPNPNYNVLQEALIDPMFARKLLEKQPATRHKGNYLPALINIINNSSSRK